MRIDPSPPMQMQSRKFRNSYQKLVWDVSFLDVALVLASDFGAPFHLSWLKFPPWAPVPCSNVAAQTRKGAGCGMVSPPNGPRHAPKVYATAEPLPREMKRNPSR